MAGVVGVICSPSRYPVFPESLRPSSTSVAPWLFPDSASSTLFSCCPWFPQTLEEIADMEEDIRRLEEDLRRKVANLKLAHTRLETRTYRPNMELCRDQVPQGVGG